MKRTILAGVLLGPVSVLLSSGISSEPRQLNAQRAAPAPSGATAAWTLKLKGDILWQQATPMGALLVSTDAALAAVDTERGQVMWEKPELGGLPADGVHMVEGSLLMEATRPGLLVIFDPVTGAVVFDSRRLNLSQIVTRRVLPQSGTLLVHGNRAAGPSVVALYDLVTGEQRWPNEALSAARWAQTPRHVRLYPSLNKADRIYVSFDDHLMAYGLADGQALWAKPASVEGQIRDIVQHPAGIIMLPEAPAEGEPTRGRRVINGVVQTGLNVARYEDGTMVA